MNFKTLSSDVVLSYACAQTLHQINNTWGFKYGAVINKCHFPKIHCPKLPEVDMIFQDSGTNNIGHACFLGENMQRYE